MIATLVHAAILAHHIYTTMHIHTQLDFTQSDDYFVKNVVKEFLWSYFTTWNFTVQVVYFMICFVEDILRIKRKSQATITTFEEKIRNAKDFIFTSLFFPCTLFVTTMFWVLYVIDEELIFPKELQKCVPWWVNQSTHSVITFALVAELLLSRHRYCRRAVGLGALILFLSIYDINFLMVFFVHGAWLYPIYHALGSWAMRLLFSFISTICLMGYYMLGELINKKLKDE